MRTDRFGAARRNRRSGVWNFGVRGVLDFKSNESSIRAVRLERGVTPEYSRLLWEKRRRHQAMFFEKGRAE